MSLYRKLLFSMIGLLVFVCVLVFGTFTILINTQFDQYRTEVHLSKLNNIVDEIKNVVENGNGDFQSIGLMASVDDFYFEVLDQEGDIVYSTDNINGPGMMGRGGSILKMQKMPVFEGIEISSYLVDEIYLVNVAYLDDPEIVKEASKFKFIMYISVFSAFVIAIIVGVFSVYKVTRPIASEMNDLVDFATLISKGHLDQKISSKASITEIENLNQSMVTMAKILSDQERLKRELVSTVSHEVKTPLTIVKSQLDAIIEGIIDLDVDELMKVKNEVNRMESILIKMDSYDLLTDVKQVLSLSIVNLNVEMESIMSILKPQFDKKNISIEIEGSNQLKVQMDINKFRQIMYNLLSNAYKFADEDSIIYVRLDDLDNKYCIQVENKGLVIEKENYEKIFQSNYRTIKAQQMDPYGKGLGLKITKTLVEALNGKLGVLESNEDRTIFNIVFSKEVEQRI